MSDTEELYEGEAEERAALLEAQTSTITLRTPDKPLYLPDTIDLPESDDVRELAKAATPDAIKALIAIVRDPKTPANARIAASTALLDRAHGKPHQAATISGNMQLTVVCAIPAPPNSTKQPITIEHSQSDKGNS
jgi:hypothetical protein